ncbi:MAG: hypothetical protein WHS46_07245 [Desulfosoma sp.]
MPITSFVAVGTERGVDLFEKLLAFLEKTSPSRLALDENPITFSTLVHMRTAPELNNETFISDQKKQILLRQGDVGVLAGLLYAFRRGNVPVHFADGVSGDILSSSGELIGSYPYVGDLDFAVETDMMQTPMELIKQRIPRYPGHDFEYELIHAYQVEASDAVIDRAIPLRNRFTAMVINAILERYSDELLVFIGLRKRFRKDLFEATEGVRPEELQNFVPLMDMIQAQNKSFVDMVED